MSPYRTPAPFTCPECGAQHNRGWVDGVETYRCLGCGYVGKDNRPRPMTDEEFKTALYRLLDSRPPQFGPFYVNPMVVARIRRQLTAAYDIPLTVQGGLVGRLFGVELYQTRSIPDGWVYAPPGEDHMVLRGGPANRQHLHQLDPTAKPYVPPVPWPSRYDILMRD